MELTYDGPSNVEFSMFLIQGSTGTITNRVDPDLNNETDSVHAITGDFKAGAYCFRVVGNISTINLDYQININATYIKEENYSIGDQKNSYGAGGLIWVSDFDPLDVICFEHETKSVNLDKNSFDITMESSLVGKTILQSSLYLWSSDAKKLAYDIVIDLHSKTQVLLDKYKATKAYYEDLAAKLKIVDGILKFVIDVVLAIVTDGASTVTEKVCCFIACEAIGFAMDSLSLEAWARSFIPEKEIMETEQLLQYFTFIETALYVGSFSNSIIINLFSYYTLSYDDLTKKLELKRVYDFNVKKTVYRPEDDENTPEIEADTVYAIQPNTWMKGRIYPLIELNNYNDARNHIKHHYDEIDPLIKKQIYLRGGQDAELDRGGSAWFWYRAQYTGTYQFFSSGDVPTTDTFAAELFNDVVKGRSNVGMIQYDDSEGYTGHFNLNYYMEEDEIVWIRVHGKNWRINEESFVINVSYIDAEKPDFEMKESTPYQEFKPNLCEFERDPTMWFSMKFPVEGQKVIQNFANDRLSNMKVFDYRGELVAATGTEPGGYANNGFLSFDAKADSIYLLKVYSPKYGKTANKMKISAASVEEKYSTINDLDRFYEENGDYDIDLKKGQTSMNIFIPNKTAGYEFYGCEGMKVDIYDTYDGTRINKDSVKDLNKSNGFYEMMGVEEYRAIGYLERGHEYLLVTYMTDLSYDSMSYSLDISLFSNGYYVLPLTTSPRTISMDKDYDEIRYYLYGNATAAQTKDTWLKFESSGYRVFTLFGNFNNLRLELYDEMNNLLESDDTNKGANSTNFFCYYMNADENYRIRIVDRRFSTSNIIVKLTITPVKQYYDSFEDMYEFKSGNAYNGGNTSYFYGNINCGDNSVGYFVPDKTGYYRFQMINLYTSTLKVSVIDTTKSESLIKGVDYSGGDTLGDNGSILKYMEKGRYYYIIHSQKDNGGASYNLRVSYYGSRSNNVSATVQYSGGKDKEDLYAVYTPEKTGYVCIDTSMGNPYNVGASIHVYDMTVHDNGIDLTSISPLKSKYQSGKELTIVYLTKGVNYMLRISKSGYTSSSGNFYAYFRDPTTYGNETGSIYVTQYDDAMRYIEETCALCGKQTMTYSIYYQYGGKRIFQTFGKLDTILELRNSSGSVLARDDNSGYNTNALINYNLSSSTYYYLVVSLKNPLDGGYIKTTVTPVHDYDYCSWYYSFNSYGSSPMNVGISVNGSRVVRFVPKTSRSYTVTLNSNDLDAYLYIVDASDGNGRTYYNDDGGGNGNSLIRKTLIANQEYYIVASAYDPSCQFGNATLEIK